MKNSPLRVCITTVIISAIICLIICAFIMKDINPPIGHTVTEKEQIISSAPEGSEGKEGTVVHTYVYLGATSKLYKDEKSTIPTGIFLDIFGNVDLAELIDNEGFPYKMEYFAVTSSAREVRYLFTTESGSSYWVEP